MTTPRPVKAVKVEVNRLVELASEVLERRLQMHGSLSGADKDKKKALGEILRVGTSAGGARAKESSVKRWPEFAKRAEVEKKTIQAIRSHHRVL